MSAGSPLLWPHSSTCCVLNSYPSVIRVYTHKMLYVKVKDTHYVFHASVCVTGESDKHGDKEEFHLLLMWLGFIKWVSLTVTAWWCKGMFLGAVKGIWHTSHSALAQTRWFVESDWRAAQALFSLGRNAGPGFVCPTDHQKTALH